MHSSHYNQTQLAKLGEDIQRWSLALGFQQCSVITPDLSADFERLQAWLAEGYQGEMSYLENNLELRREPLSIVPGSCRIISVRMNYQPPALDALKVLKDPDKAYIARYTLGRDYH
ncbi:MAG: QueG-associated DUF1730 domain-containing protein, partial [Pseudomonadales bacterium]